MIVIYFLLIWLFVGPCREGDSPLSISPDNTNTPRIKIKAKDKLDVGRFTSELPNVLKSLTRAYNFG